MTVFGGKGEGKVHPSRHIFIMGPPIATYIYYLIILGGEDIMDNEDKGVFNQNR